jgi:predicted Rossmann fold nucleotide-binding protein DprA/Smf involved in DNA uptake
MLIEEARAGYSPPDGAGEAIAREEPTAAASPSGSTQVDSVYAAVLPIIISHLNQPHDAKSLAQLLDVRPAQLLDWLDRAVLEGRIMKNGRPIRYIVAPPSFDLDAAE